MVVGKFSCLDETVEAFVDLEIDVAVVDEGFEVVLVDDGLWDEFDRDTHVFGSCHEGVEVEVGDVKCGITCFCGGDGAIEVTFDGWHVDGWCAGGASVIVIVVGDGETNAVHFSLKWFERGDDADVADCAAFWNVVEGDGCYCLRSFGSEPVKFVAPSLLPVLLVRSFY